MSDQSVGLLTQLQGERRAPPAERVRSGPTSVSGCGHAGEASEPLTARPLSYRIV